VVEIRVITDKFLLLNCCCISNHLRAIRLCNVIEALKGFTVGLVIVLGYYSLLVRILLGGFYRWFQLQFGYWILFTIGNIGYRTARTVLTLFIC
jgi:hypothetical protein